MPSNEASERNAPTLHREEGEYRISRGQFEGIVRPYENRYWFSVWDITLEQPTIHGFGVNFQQAIAAVEQLVDLLEKQVGRQSECNEEATLKRIG